MRAFDRPTVGCGHLILEFPATSHVALDLIQLLTTLLYDTCQPDWSTLTTHEQTSLILGDPPSTLSTKFHHVWLQSTLPAIFDYVSQLETVLYNIAYPFEIKKLKKRHNPLYYPFGKGPGQHIIRCLKNKKCENERTNKKPNTKY